MPAPPKRPNRQPSKNFADIISQRAQEVRAQPHGQEILQLQSPEQIAEFMSPMMMGVGNLTNITGRGLPQIISNVTKSEAQQMSPSVANWYNRAFGMPENYKQRPEWQRVLSPPKAQTLAEHIRDMNPKVYDYTKRVFADKGFKVNVGQNKIHLVKDGKTAGLIERTADGSTFYLTTGGGVFPLNQFLKKKMKAGTIQSKNLEDILQWLADNLK